MLLLRCEVSPVKDEAVSALTMLGFSPAPTAKVVTAILHKDPSQPVEQVVKLALKQIKEKPPPNLPQRVRLLARRFEVIIFLNFQLLWED